MLFNGSKRMKIIQGLLINSRFSERELDERNQHCDFLLI